MKHQSDPQRPGRWGGRGVDEKQLKFLDKNLGKYPPAGLTAALSWLAKKLPGDVYKRLDGPR